MPKVSTSTRKNRSGEISRLQGAGFDSFARVLLFDFLVAVRFTVFSWSPATDKLQANIVRCRTSQRRRGEGSNRYASGRIPAVCITRRGNSARRDNQAC